MMLSINLDCFFNVSWYYVLCVVADNALMIFGLDSCFSLTTLPVLKFDGVVILSQNELLDRGSIII